MIDHVSLHVRDLPVARRFYAACLGALGKRLVAEWTDEVTGETVASGFGDEKGDFWIGTEKAPVTGVHVAFKAASRAEVDAFHAAGLAAGGVDNGTPGLRPEYSPTYYGAFLLDPDGNNVEAVCRAPA